jgi:hypothetical protein
MRSGEFDRDGDPADRMYQRVAEITGGDPLPYGVAIPG